MLVSCQVLASVEVEEDGASTESERLSRLESRDELAPVLGEDRKMDGLR